MRNMFSNVKYVIYLSLFCDLFGTFNYNAYLCTQKDEDNNILTLPRRSLKSAQRL